MKAKAETGMAGHECHEAASIVSRPYGKLSPSSRGHLSMSRRLPVGVVAVITPFNFPLGLGIRSVAPALALGNAVILKPDLRTPVSGGVLFARIFEEAGLPEGLLHILPGGADVGEALVANKHVRVISFTGSTEAGRKVGGPQPAISNVLTSSWAVTMRWWFSRTSTLTVRSTPPHSVRSATRARSAWRSDVIVSDKIADEFVAKLAEKAAALRVAIPLQMPLT